jgi:uncharacterized coiled-coil protein SlyX
MTDDSSPATLSARPAQAIRGLVRGAVVLFLMAAAALVWFFWRERPETAPAPFPAQPAAVLPVAASPNGAITPFSLSVAEARMAALEARLAEAERRAASAKADASRAERLLILTSVRRAVDQGLPLGYLEGLLQMQFGTAAPSDVALIITGARQPVTLAQLNQGLAEAQLSLASPQGNLMDSVMQGLQGLVVVRRTDAPSEAPAHKFARATQAMAQERVDLAIREVATMPGAVKARGWLNQARRYVAIRAALSRLEAAALLTPAAAPSR